MQLNRISCFGYLEYNFIHLRQVLASAGADAHADAASEAEEIAPNATVYVRNINERVKIPAVTEGLRELFSTFGEVKDIIAKKSLKRKGQAFVVFDNADSAQEAIDEINGFELFGQQLSLEFAKSRSDATVLREEGEAGLATHKQQRLAEKERKNAAAAAEAEAEAEKARNNKRVVEDLDAAERPSKMARVQAVNKDIPDEYLPPNKILYVRPVTKDMDDESVKSQFRAFAGYQDTRIVRARDLAFVEFTDEGTSAAAKAALQNMTINGAQIKVTFRRA